MEFLRPVQGVGHQEVAHLVAAEIEDVGAPVGLLAAARIRVLVDGVAGKAAERPFIAREVGRHPVHEDSDAGGMQGIDKRAELVRAAPPRGRGVVPGDLVAPGTAEGMLGHREELDVGKAVLGDVVHQLAGQARVIGPGLPRANVHLVDAHRLRAQGIGAGGIPRRHPLSIAVGPAVGRGLDYRCRLRRALRAPRHGIGFVGAGAVVEDGELVQRARAHIGDEDLPHAG